MVDEEACCCPATAAGEEVGERMAGAWKTEEVEKRRWRGDGRGKTGGRADPAERSTGWPRKMCPERRRCAAVREWRRAVEITPAWRSTTEEGRRSTAEEGRRLGHDAGSVEEWCRRRGRSRSEMDGAAGSEEGRRRRRVCSRPRRGSWRRAAGSRRNRPGQEMGRLGGASGGRLLWKRQRQIRAPAWRKGCCGNVLKLLEENQCRICSKLAARLQIWPEMQGLGMSREGRKLCFGLL